MKKLFALALLLMSQAVMAQGAPVIETSSLRGGVAGEHYYTWLRANEEVMWEVVGSLPDGLHLNNDNDWEDYENEIYGDLTAGNHSVTIKITDPNNPSRNSQKTFTISVVNRPGENDPPVFLTSSLQNGKVGSYYSEYINATSNCGVNMQLIGSLPQGFEFDGYYLEGITRTKGTHEFTIRATDECNGKHTDKQFTIHIEAPDDKPYIRISSIANGELGGRYDVEFEVYRYEALSATGLPPGLELIYGEYDYIYIYGTPTKIGTYNVTIKAINEKGEDERPFTIVIEQAKKPTITTASPLPDGELGRWYSECIESASISASWSISSGNKLPDGLDLYEGSRCAWIEGTPTKTGIYNFTLKTQNNAGSDTKQFRIEIKDRQAPVITTPSQLSGEYGAHYSLWLESNEYVWWEYVSESSNLPNGLSYDGWSGIYGTPQEAGSFTFTIKATSPESGLSSKKTFTLVISEPKTPTITTAIVQNGEIGYEYHAYFESASASASFSVTNGSLPPGMELDSYGDGWAEIYDYSSLVAGEYTFTLTATNIAGVSESKEFTIKVFATAQKPAFITTNKLPDGKLGVYYDEPIASTSPSAWFSFENKGNLPSNFDVDNWGGGFAGIRGNFTTAGTYKFTVRIENSAGFETKEFTITVKDESTRQTPPPVIIPLPPKDGNSDDDDDTPVLPQVALGSVGMQVSGKTIMLTNLPANAKVSVYTLNGKQVYSNAGAATPATMQIPVQATGMYIVKAGAQSFRATVR